MGLEELKDLVNKIKSSLDDCATVYESEEGDLYGSNIERYDDCCPTAHEIDEERLLLRSVDKKSVIHQIEEGIRKHGLVAEYVKTLDREGTTMKDATLQQRCRAAFGCLF